MKKLIFSSLIFSFIISLYSLVYGQETPLDYSDEIVKVKLIPLSTNIEEGIVTMVAELNVVNNYSSSLKGVLVKVSEFYGLSISPSTIYVGDISENGSFISKEEIIVQYPVSSQGDMNAEQYLKWTVDYTSSFEGAEQENMEQISGLRISEIMISRKNPKKEPQWIEFINTSDNPIRIVDYQIRNSSGVIYTFPKTLLPIPPSALIVVVFDGKTAESDDLSFEHNNAVILHSDLQNVFSESMDTCTLHSEKTNTIKSIQSFAAWGNYKKDSKAKSNAEKAIRKRLWKRNIPSVKTKREDIEGPMPLMQKGGSLILREGNSTESFFVAVPTKPEEVTFALPNLLPGPQLFLPHDKLQTSADIFTFSWVPVGRGSFQFQIASDENFNNVIIDIKDLSESWFRPEQPLLRDVSLFWRVRVLDKAKTGNWSDVREFNISLPEGTILNQGKALDDILEGQPNPLGVPSRAARKDSALLCVDGCDAAHWDISNETGPQHDHSTWYCWAAAAQMLSMYRGGDVLQDEIVSYVKGDMNTTTQASPNLPHGISPENSLPHGGGASASLADASEALQYALQATETQLNIIQGTKPTDNELRNFIDAGRPLRYSTGPHAMVVDGYRTISGVFQARFLNTDNDGTIEWRPWAAEPFSWCAIPDAGLTGRNRDERLASDFDIDGMIDFDEDERFPTDRSYPDTEFDGVADKADVRSYALRNISADVDGDSLRAEIDEDSDDGGLQDGLEDLDHDGNYEPGDDETDPHDASDDTAVDIDLVIAIDTTGSMWDDIDAAKASAVDIVNAIDSNTNDYRVSVISFEDFPIPPYGTASCGDYMYHDVLDFSDDKTSIVNAIQSLTLRCGADWPESHYSALMHCLNKSALGGWRDGVGKFVILISDAPPHDPEPVTGYTASDVTQAAINLDPAIIYPILIGGDITAKAYFNLLADGTGGKLFEAANADEVVETIIEAVETIFNAPVADADGPYSACVGSQITFDGSGSYDTDGDIVLYEWDFENDGVYDISSTEPTATWTYPPEYNGLVSLKVTDNDGLTGYDTAAVAIGDPIAPEVNIVIPNPGDALQDGILFSAAASDNCELDKVFFYVREPNGATGIPIGYENMEANLNGTTNNWNYNFSTTLLDDGYYVLLAKATDKSGNVKWSEPMPISIRNWAVVWLFPASESIRAGRTLPVKFSLRIAESVDPTQPFVRNEELEIRICNETGETMYQTCLYGDHSTDYRINSELYITNFKTMKKPATYQVQIWRPTNNFLVGDFRFTTFSK